MNIDVPFFRPLLIFCFAMVVGVCTAEPVPVGSNAPALENGAACSYQYPEGWQGYTLQWRGECKNGLADGSGVLRATAEGKPTLVFMGQMRPWLYIYGQKFNSGHL